MPAINGTIKKNATAMTPTGGTDVQYTKTSKSVPSGIEVQDASVSDFTVRPLIEMKSRPPAMGKDGNYSKRKTEMKLVIPKKRADGSTVFAVRRIIDESPVEFSDAEFNDMHFQSAQLISDPEYYNFWRNGVVDA